MTASAAAHAATLLAIGPTESSVKDSGNAPSVGTRAFSQAAKVSAWIKQLGWYEMFKRQMFDVYHDGYWKSDPPPPLPTFFLIMPAQRDSREIARMKELGLAPRDRFPDQSEWEKKLGGETECIRRL
jgi:hypothetical protein